MHEPILYEVSLTQLTTKFGEQNRILLTVGGAETGCQFGAITYSRRTLSLHSQTIARMELFKWPERERVGTSLYVLHVVRVESD